MPNIEKRTISLPAEHAAYLDEMVASGNYASASEVVRAGLRALQERDAAMEGWLRENVAQTYDAMLANPGKGLSLDSVFAQIRSHHVAGLKGRK